LSEFQRFKLFQTIQAIANRAEIRQRAAQPAIGNAWLSATGAFALNGLRSLALRADEENQAAAGGNLFQIFFCSQQAANGFAHIDNMDQIAAAVDVGPHLGIPTAGAVAEVNSRFD